MLGHTEGEHGTLNLSITADRKFTVIQSKMTTREKTKDSVWSFMIFSQTGGFKHLVVLYVGFLSEN